MYCVRMSESNSGCQGCELQLQPALAVWRKGAKKCGNEAARQSEIKEGIKQWLCIILCGNMVTIGGRSVNESHAFDILYIFNSDGSLVCFYDLSFSSGW